MMLSQRRSLLLNARQSGFTLITAIFLLVVVATLSVYMLNLRSVQQATLVYGVQGARAMQAARTGIEWGIFQTIPKAGCPGTGCACPAASTNFTAQGPAIDAFRITVTCVRSAGHFEGLVEIATFRLTATAETGVYGTLDYVSRQLQATISESPP